MMVLIEAVSVVLLLDFVSGLVHWAEDTFWVEDTPVIGPWIVRPNVLHHHDASAFTRKTWLQSSWDLLTVGFLIIAAAGYWNWLSWQVWLFVAIGVNANQIHKWNHMPSRNVPAPVRALQKIWLLQSANHHAVHHHGEKNRHYCVVTNVLNPLLDRLRFWHGLESIFVPMWGAPRREDLRDLAR